MFRTPHLNSAMYYRRTKAVAINDILYRKTIDYCVANILIFHAYKWNADIFFLFNHQAVDIFARNEKLLNVLISSIDRLLTQ